MVESIFQQPTDQQLEEFVKGDPVIVDDVMHLLLPQLHRWAIHKYDNLPQDEVKSVVNRVLAEACRNHSKYNPQISKITTFLIGLIDLRMASLYQYTRRKSEVEDLFSDTQENCPQPLYNLTNKADFDSQFERKRFFKLVRDRLSDSEKAVLDLMLDGEKSQDKFLAILQIHHSIENPASEVKNFKERLKRKVKSIAEELGFEKHDLLDG